MYGYINKEDLAKWDKEDMQKARSCYWMMKEQFDPPENKFKKRQYIMKWYKRLCECLPAPELNDMYQKLKNISMFWNLYQFESIVRFARYDIVQKLYAYDYQKAKMIDDYAKKPVCEPQDSKSVMEEYRINSLTQPLPHNSVAFQERKEKQMEGYIPTYEILLKLPPMEVLDYAGHRLVKYDKSYGYFAAIVSFPKDTNKQPEVIYDANANVVEAKAENLFETSIDNYLRERANPYGDKSYNEVDISNVQKIMHGGTDPLSKDIF